MRFATAEIIVLSTGCPNKISALEIRINQTIEYIFLDTRHSVYPAGVVLVCTVIENK